MEEQEKKLTAQEAGILAYEKITNDGSQVDNILSSVEEAAKAGKFSLFYKNRVSAKDKSELESYGYSVAFKNQGTVIGWAYVPKKESSEEEEK